MAIKIQFQIKCMFGKKKKTHASAYSRVSKQNMGTINRTNNSTNKIFFSYPTTLIIFFWRKGTAERKKKQSDKKGGNQNT